MIYVYVWSFGGMLVLLFVLMVFVNAAIFSLHSFGSTALSLVGVFKGIMMMSFLDIANCVSKFYGISLAPRWLIC